MVDNLHARRIKHNVGPIDFSGRRAQIPRSGYGLQPRVAATATLGIKFLFHLNPDYSYECSEQPSSRIIGIAALRDVLTAFKAKDLPSPPQLEAAVTRDLKRLQGMQNEDGGFAFWRRGDESWPYVSIHVAHALARARQKKFEVPNEMFDHSRKYLREIESHIPSIYSIDTRRAIIAYALYVRMQMDDRDAAGARKLIAEAGLDHLSMESVGWLLSVLSNDKDSVNEVAAIRHLLNNRARPHRVVSWCLRQRLKKCITRKLSAEGRPIACALSSSFWSAPTAAALWIFAGDPKRRRAALAAALQIPDCAPLCCLW